MRRPRRSVPAAITAAVLCVGCGVVAMTLVQRLLGEPPLLPLDSLITRLHSTAWQDTTVTVIAAVAMTAGAVLLFTALRPGRPVTLTVATPSGVDASASRHGLRRDLHEVARHVDGVSDARLRLRRRRIRARVGTRRTVADGLVEAVRVALEQRLDEFALQPRPRVKVTVRSRR